MDHPPWLKDRIWQDACLDHSLSACRVALCRSQLYGQDSPELRAVGFVKGKLIAQIMQARGERPTPLQRPQLTYGSEQPLVRVAGWSHDDVLFVDDSMDHIEKARSVCLTLHVPDRGGMKEAELAEIRKAAARS